MFFCLSIEHIHTTKLLLKIKCKAFLIRILIKTIYLFKMRIKIVSKVIKHEQKEMFLGVNLWS